MATYVVGDLHGCFRTFESLLEEISFDRSKDRLYHTGDFVNGGPGALATLRWFFNNQDVANSVLGNHDLHLLAVAYGSRKARRKDDFDDILRARDRVELMEWLRRRPMMISLGEQRILVHAGLLPDWSVNTAQGLASEVEQALRTPAAARFLKGMYGNRPRSWDKALKSKSQKKRWRVIVNGMTRMRALRSGGRLDFEYSGTYEAMPQRLSAWFDAKAPAWEGHQIIFGHWSALGLRQTERIIALDTGCRWGRQLTAVRLEDGKIYQVDCRDKL